MNKKYSRKFDDGQLVMLVYMLGYILLLIALVSYLGYDKGLMVMDIPSMVPLFSDLHVITASYETIIDGGDPYLQNDADPWGRPYNYPRIWLALGYLGLNSTNLFFFGAVMAIIYVGLTFKLFSGLSKKEGLYASLLLFSPSSALAIERGNIDLVIYILLTLSIFIYKGDSIKNSAKVFLLIFLASALKLYPIFAVFVFLKEKKNVFFKIFISMNVLFLLYFIVSWSDLEFIFKNTPNAPAASYGVVILPMHVLFAFFEGGQEAVPRFRLIGLLIGNFILLLVMLGIYIKVKNVKYTFELFKCTEDKKLVFFYLGVGIFVGSFALGNNWDYRLIFLFFTVPQLLYWFKHQIELRTVVFSCLGLILALVQWNFFSYERLTRIMVINELCTWVLVGLLIYLFLLSSPLWFQKFLKIN